MKLFGDVIISIYVEVSRFFGQEKPKANRRSKEKRLCLLFSSFPVRVRVSLRHALRLGKPGSYHVGQSRALNNYLALLGVYACSSTPQPWRGGRSCSAAILGSIPCLDPTGYLLILWTRYPITDRVLVHDEVPSRERALSLTHRMGGKPRCNGP